MVMLSDVVMRTALPLFGGCLFALIGVLSNRAGIFGSTRRQAFARLIATHIVPVVVFHELGAGLPSSNLSALLIVATHTVLSILLGGIFGWVSGTALGLTTRQKHFVMVAAGFGSSGIVPPLFSNVVCQDFAAGPGFDGCSAKGSVLAAVGLALSTVGLYAAGFWVLEDADSTLPTIGTAKDADQIPLLECDTCSRSFTSVDNSTDVGVMPGSKSPPRDPIGEYQPPLTVPKAAPPTDTSLAVLMLQLPKIKTPTAAVIDDDNWHEDEEVVSPRELRTSDSLHNLMNLFIGSAIDEFFGTDAGFGGGVRHRHPSFGSSNSTPLDPVDDSSFFADSSDPPTAHRAFSDDSFESMEATQEEPRVRRSAQLDHMSSPFADFDIPTTHSSTASSTKQNNDWLRSTPQEQPCPPNGKSRSVSTSARSFTVPEKSTGSGTSQGPPPVTDCQRAIPVPRLPLVSKPPKPQQVPTHSIASQVGPSFKDHLPVQTSWVHVAAPTVIGAALGLLVGSIPAAHGLLFAPNAPLLLVGWLTLALSYALLPLLMVVLGGVWGSSLGCVGRLPSRVVGLVVLLRMLVLPVAGRVILGACHRVGWPVADPMLWFVSLLQYSLPTSLLLSLVAGMMRRWESAVAQIMLWELIAYSCMGPLYVWNNTLLMQAWG